MQGAFSLFESYSGILLGIFYGFVFGFRKRQQLYNNDIQPVERLYFNWKRSAKYGLWVGIGTGLTIGVLGVLIQRYIHEDFTHWLDNYLFISGTFRTIANPNLRSAIVFCFAFVVAFPVGFALMTILAGRDPEKIREEDKSVKHRLNYGMRKSILISGLYAFITSIGVVTIYVLLFFICTRHPPDIVKTLKIGAGLGIMSFLWFGGFEVIQHWTLRLYLYLYGIVPIQFGPWLKKMHQIAFIQRSGANLEFQHPTLKAYLQSIPVKIVEKGKIKGRLPAAAGVLPEIRVTRFKSYYRWPVLALIILFLSGTGLYPFWVRYIHPVYWTKSNQLNSKVLDTNEIQKLTETSFRVKKSGELKLIIQGTVNVGTFVSNVHAEGTRSGFLGFPLPDYDTTFNIVPQFKHGALLYRKLHVNEVWKSVIDPEYKFWPWQDRIGEIQVKAGEILCFIINDKEQQNDCGEFMMDLAITPLRNSKNDEKKK